MRKFPAIIRATASVFLAFILTFQLSIGTALAERDSVARTRIRFSPINLFAPGLPSIPTYRTSVPTLVPSLESQMAAMELAIENAPSAEEAARIAPLPKDIGKLAGQKHRIYRTEGTTDADRRFVLDREIPLDQITADNPEVHMIDPAKELRIVYNPAAKELEVQRYTKINGVDTLTDGHMFPNIEITTQPGNHILQDANSIMFATTEGVRAILGIDLSQYVFKASMPSSLLIETPVGRTISKIEYVNPGSTPRHAVNTNEILDADLGLTLNGDEDKLHIISRRELITRLGLWKTVQLYMLSLANPDIDNAHVVAKALSQNVEEVGAFISARDNLLERGEGSDLMNAALANMARNTDFVSQSSLISRSASGSNSFETLAQSPRHVFGATGEWIQNFSQIESRRLADVAAGQSPKPWKEYLIDSIRNPDPEVSEALAEAAEKQPEIVLSKTKNIINTVKKLATPKRMLLLAAFFAFDIANIQTQGAPVRLAMSALTNMFSWAMEVPGIGKLISQFESLPGYLQEPWALSRLAVATAAVLALRPLSMIAAQRYARTQGNDWSQKKAFFTYGLRLYSRVVYPVQKLFWEKIARQHQLYAALKAGLSPLNSAAWVNPFSGNSNDSSSDRLESAVQEEAVRKSRAMILAAAIVSEKSRSEGNPIDPTTLMLLLKAPQGEAAQTLLSALGTATGESMWMDVTNQTISALAKLTDGGAGEIDEQSMQEYHTIFSRIAHELRSQSELAQGSRIGHARVVLQQFVRSRYLEFKRMTSKNIIPFMFFGLPQFRIYETYSNAEVDDSTADIAEHQYRDDYDFSTLFYAGADAATFGAMTTGNVAASAEILANQSEQVFIYGVQLGYDVLTTGTLNPLSNPYAPVTDEMNSELRVRQQTFLEAARELGSAMLDPNTPSTLATHRQYMVNTLTGFQVRMAAGTLARGAGLAAIGIASGAIGLETLSRVVSAIPLQATALLAKIGITTDGPGYAVGWAYISHSMRVLKNSVVVNDEALRLAHYLIDAGLRTNSAERLRTGVATMLGLYQTHNTPLPEQFTAVAAEEYSAELAKELYEYSLSHVPAPTQYSASMAKFLNVGLGALVSTILYVSLSKTLFDPNAAPIALFTGAVTSFALTFVGLAAAQPVVQRALQAGQSLVNRCKAALTRSK